MLKAYISQHLIREIRRDLRRSHPHAAERIGFAFAKMSGQSLHILSYTPVADDCYVRDISVGARINHKAILAAMRKSKSEQLGIFHVHEHGGKGYPQYSPVDLHDHPEFIRGFRNGNSQVTHGFLLLSEDKMTARIYQPNELTFQDILQYSTDSAFVAWLRRLWL